MELKVIGSTDLRTRTREILERVKYKGDGFLVQTFGQPTAVVISIEEYRRLNRGLGNSPEQETREFTSAIKAMGGAEI